MGRLGTCCLNCICLRGGLIYEIILTVCCLFVFLSFYVLQPYQGSQKANVFDGTYGSYYAAMRDSINNAGVDFAVFMGDVKSGSTLCDDLAYSRFQQLAGSFQVPSLLAIGGKKETTAVRTERIIVCCL